MTAVVALTERMTLGALRDDLPFAIVAPAGHFVVFNFGLRNVIDTGAMSYPQYLLPVIIVQVMLLGALTTVDRAARDQESDFGVRLRTLPISALVPLMARMLYCLFRGALALLAAIAVGYMFGFRMSGGFVYAAAFAIVVLTLTLAVSLGADATGTGIAGAGTTGAEIGRSGAASQLLLIPQMLLVLLSTGMAPADAFPDWLHPFVRYQPVSQVTETLRGFSTGHVVVSNLATSLAWCLGLLVVFGACAVRMQRRTH
jgi:ABC-2 type transport system permease protein